MVEAQPLKYSSQQIQNPHMEKENRVRPLSKPTKHTVLRDPGHPAVLMQDHQCQNDEIEWAKQGEAHGAEQKILPKPIVETGHGHQSQGKYHGAGIEWRAMPCDGSGYLFAADA